jgi:hypothetical protein
MSDAARGRHLLDLGVATACRVGDDLVDGQPE